MKKERAIKTTYSRPMMVFKTNITKGTKSFCLKCNFFWKNGAFLYSIEINSFAFFTFYRGRCRRYTREEIVGVDNQACVDRDGNPNSVAGTEKIELVNVGFIIVIITLSSIVVPFDMLQQYIRLVWSPHSS